MFGAFFTGILIAAGIVIFIFIIMGLIASSSGKEKIENIKLYNERNKIPINSKMIGCIELNSEKYQTKAQYGNKMLLGRLFNIWKEENRIILCESFNINKPKDLIAVKTIIPIENIKFFTREGEYRVDNIVQGGGVNFKGAIVGGVIAGEAGAILAGREKITTTQKEVDKRQTYLYYIDNNQEKRIVFFSESYDLLLELIPNKEIGYIEKHKIVEFKKSNDTQEKSIYKDIEELSNLKDKGILTEEEFTEKKKMLLEKIQ
ncbi:SHOCT domain-containing protein [Clostridium beijerinckii]|uniref:SHOCT domain-containing protein n=1 Tax=Clostridium beijerinckii TaxID=1520 RepID=A0AAX0B0Z4_CLOBE|nr:SHOCT domain-containing protein [Clostridium beijerinckii]NRT88873.1 hypothetical protein [Clostridium beijerinckii]NYC74328.1 hypothetical protein [Clostridium beijerinckii]